MFKPDTTTYDNGLETNIEAIAQQICAGPPKAPCSIQLMLDHEAAPDVEFDLVKDFTLACMHLLFGPDTTPFDLNEAQFDRLNQYVKSIGYQMTVNTADPDAFKIRFDRYQSAKPNPFEHLRKQMNMHTK